MMIKQIYGSLVRLFPLAHRDLFEKEITTVFEQGFEQSSRRGRVSAAWFLVRELATLAAMAWTERRLQCNQRGAYLSDVLLRQESWPLSTQEGQKRLRLLIRHMEHAIANHDFPRARKYAFEEQRLRLYMTENG